MINLGVTGSRHGMNQLQRSGAENYCGVLSIHSQPITFRQGCCVGVDEELTILLNGVGYTWIIGYPPLNKTYLSTIAVDLSNDLMTARGYLARNRAIVDDCERLLAFPDSMSPKLHSGTWYTINYARQTKRKLRIFYPDGSIKDEFNLSSEEASSF
jgi:hypothetical protein